VPCPHPWCTHRSALPTILAGEGPSRKAQLNSPWAHRVVALTEAAEGQQQQVVELKLGHPTWDRGYYGTARMVSGAGDSMQK